MLSSPVIASTMMIGTKFEKYRHLASQKSRNSISPNSAGRGAKRSRAVRLPVTSSTHDKAADLKTAYSLLDALISAEIELENNGILHRDINPNNIIVCKDSTIYLIDFGLAKIIGGESLTRTTAPNGPFTPGYAPHEQFANNKLMQDVRTDLFQIGVTIYECCTGNNPFIQPNETVYQIMSRTMTLDPPSLRISGDTKGQFSQFIAMLMAKNQSQRPDSAKDAMRYLNAIRPTLDMED